MNTQIKNTYKWINASCEMRVPTLADNGGGVRVSPLGGMCLWRF